MTHRIRFLLGLAAILTLSLCAGAFAQPTLTSVAPVENDLDAAPATDVSATFDQSMSGAGASFFIVHGSMTGERTGTYGGAGTATLSFDPTADFKPGERVDVTLTAGLMSATGVPIGSPYSWQFLAAAATAPGTFPNEHAVDAALVGAYSVYAADVDGDGDLDVLGAAGDSDEIAWWENTTGYGSAWIEHTVDAEFDGANSVYAADVDGDGDVDILGTAAVAEDITWWENTAGDGSAWTEHTVDALFQGAASVYAADVDGDGDLDVLGASRADDIMWWENTAGDGSAWTEHTVDAGFQGANSVYAADVDGDGDLDVLGAAQTANEIAWWENTAGDGSAWTEHTVDAFFDYANSVYAADVDGDGDLDVLGAAGFANDIAWWENTTGDGSAWTEHTVDAEFGFAVFVYAADVDGDGDLDVLGAAGEADDITWWENTAGDGSAWTEHAVDDFFDGATSVYAADVDGDGDLDVLGAATDADGITWWENAAPAAVTSTIPVRNEAAAVSTDVSATFSGNMSVGGASTFVVYGSMTGERTGTYGGGGTPTLSFDPMADFKPGERVDVTLTAGLTSATGVPVGSPYSWHFLAAAGTAPGAFPYEHAVDASFDGAISVYAADVDGDGDLDVVGAAQMANDIIWWENTTGNGSAWSEHTVDADFAGAVSVYAADVDGDGDQDVLGAAGDADDIAWWENTAGDGSAWTEHTVDANFDFAHSVYAADVDGDGDLDVLGAAANGNAITWWENTAGDGSIWTEHALSTTFDNARSVYAADVDGDGDVDVLGAALFADDIVWWENTAGDGSAWTEHTVDASFGGARCVRAADMDGDGDLDVLGTAYRTNDIGWWENTAGDGSAWVKHLADSAFGGARCVRAADVDGDGDADILGAAFESNAVTWWENTAGDGIAWSAHPVDAAFGGAAAVVAADVDGDGDLDVLGAAHGAGEIAWWRNAELSTTVSMPSVTATYGQELTVPVSIDDATGIRAAEVFVEYDTALLTAFSEAASSLGTLSQGWAVETNTEAGAGSMETLKIALATDASSVTGAQTLINVRFTVNDVRAPASSPLTLTHVLLNNGSPPNTPVDGLVTRVGNDGSITSLPVQIFPGETVTVTVVDADADLDGLAGTDQVSVSVVNTTTGDTVVLMLDEDPATAGAFVGAVGTEFGTAAIADGLIQAQAGEAIVTTFSDALDGSGSGPVSRTAQTDVIGGADGAIAITLVSQPGDPLYIRVTDADLNVNSSSAETASVTVTNSRTAESFAVILTEVDVDDEVFFGFLPTTAGASTATEMNTAEEDIVTATYHDALGEFGADVDITATDDVIDPWGDADDNEAVQAFDASETLLDVLSGGTLLTDLERRSANVDMLPVTTGINPFDASLILQKRVGLIADFPVQDPASENHPQGAPASPKGLPEVRLLSLRAEDGYLSIWVDERSGLLSGDLSITGISGPVELGAELGDYLLASRKIEEGLRVVFAGAQAVSGPGELLRVYSGVGPDRVRLTRADFNNGEIRGQTDEGMAAVRPVSYALHANAPNPFNPETVIGFDLPQASAVRLEIFDVVGQTVRTLLSEEHPAGSHRAVWDGRDESGSPVSSGVYFYRMQAGAFAQTHRMLLLR